MEILPEEVFSKYPTWFKPDVITLTTSVQLKTPIDKEVPLEVLFHLIPISRTDLTQPKNVREIKIPWPEESGIFLSCYYGQEVRGIVKKRKRGNWVNSVFVDLSTSSKNINIGLSHCRLLITGAKNFNEIEEAVTILIDTLNFMNSGCELAQEYPELTKELIQEVLKTGSTESTGIRTGLPCPPNSNSSTFDPEKVADLLLSSENTYSEEDDPRKTLISWLYLLIQDYLDYEAASIKMNWAARLFPFLREDLEEDEYRVVLIKMRLSMPTLPLEKLYNAFEETGDFCLTYEPMILPYLKVQKLVNQIKKNGANCHSLNIKPGGQIDLSCVRIEDLVDLLENIIQIYSTLKDSFIEA